MNVDESNRWNMQVTDTCGWNSQKCQDLLPFSAHGLCALILTLLPPSPHEQSRAERQERLLRATENRARNRREMKRFSLKISEQVLLLQVWGFVQVGSVAIMLTGMRWERDCVRDAIQQAAKTPEAFSYLHLSYPVSFSSLRSSPSPIMTILLSIYLCAGIQMLCAFFSVRISCGTGCWVLHQSKLHRMFSKKFWMQHLRGCMA